MAEAPNPFVGQTLGGIYRLEKHLNDGHFSHVFKATDISNGNELAVKLLLPSAATSAVAVIEFETEARLLHILSSCQNVTNLEFSGESQLLVEMNGVPTPIAVRFHAIELADGDLSELLAHRHLLDWSDRLRLFRDLVAGVHQMHLNEVVHRDLKSSNVLLFDTDRTHARAKVSDLGRSCSVTEPPRFSIESYVTGRGDLSFAPPELLWFQGTNDPVDYRRSDVYLLGSVFFELATAQGISGMAIPDWHSEVQRAVSIPEGDRPAAFVAAANTMRSGFELPLSVLSAELPPSIRHYGVSLIRQMCDPRPELRERRVRIERKNPAWGLEWIFRRVDIMRKNLDRSATTSSARRKVGAQ